VESFREQGLEPEALVALLARLGTSLPVEPIADRAELVDTFDLAAFGRAPARFDEAELARLNAAIVHRMPFERAQERLPEGMDAAAWDAIRPNLERLSDTADWWRVVTGPIEPPAFDEDTRAYLAQAAGLLTWGDDPWNTLAGALKEASGRKGKALFHPLRLALTGRDSGPDMHALLPLIGEAEARRRLERAASGAT
jgi:glutamyl-tRNA synthetase